MGSEVEEQLDEFNDVENTVFVAVGKNVKESKSLISWSLEFFKDMSNIKICLLHIHQPPPLITLLVNRSTSRLREQVFKACRELEQKKMHNTLNQYSLTLSQSGVHAGKVWIDGDNVEKSIVQTISQYGIRWLVMGAAADDLYTEDMSELKSSKAIYVCEQAPISCHIWFACNGYLIHIRERWSNPRPRFRSISALSPSRASEEEMLTRHHEAGADMKTRNNVDTFENSMSTENALGTSNLTRSLTFPAIETSLTLYHTLDADEIREKPTEPPAMYLEGPKRLSSSDLHDKLEYAKTDAENSKQKAFEQSIKRWRAEEDAKEALDKAEVMENSLMEEITKRKEKEALLATQTQEIETMKNQQDQFMKELEIIKDQKPELIDRISNAHAAEKELEEKIIQAVNLLITFKERRDNLQEECDNARRQISRLSKHVNKEEDTKFSHAQFYKPSFMEIMEATQDFNQSLKIGEGRYGSVYKGVLRHVRIAIKMLPSLGSQGDAEFEDEAEVLSRIRHPNIVTLIGVCPETRSLVYEYLENGSLENRITSRGKNPPLQWHSRIQIASDICSALIFIHSSKPPITHGNLNLNNILLDSNYVSKLSDLGINRFIPDSEKLSVTSDVYSFGVVLLRILTGRPASSIVDDVKYALKNGNFGTVLDMSAGDWPIEHVKDLAYLGLRCCEKDPMNRPDLVDDVLTKLEIMKNLFPVSPVESENQRRIPSYFVCPIFQEVMKDPYIAADGFTYEEDAIKGWINSGHKTSPMTNLKLDHCDLLPNHALTYAIQEWQQHS